MHMESTCANRIAMSTNQGIMGTTNQYQVCASAPGNIILRFEGLRNFEKQNIGCIELQGA